MPLNNPSTEEKISVIDERVKTLEHNNKQDEILEILNKIKIRLIGDIEGESPGLISDVRQLKKDYEANRLQLIQIDINVQEIKKIQSNTVDLEKEIKDLKKTVAQLKKWSFVGYGVLLCLGWIVSNADGIKTILKAIKGN